MGLPFDITRCSGFNCPMRHDCLRHTDIPEAANVLGWFATQPWVWHAFKNKPECAHFIKDTP